MKYAVVALVFIVGCSADPVAGPERFQALSRATQNRLWVSTTDHDVTTGGLSQVFLDEGRVVSVPVDCNDPFVRPGANGALVVNRDACSNLQLFGPSLNVERQFSLGKGSNPQDVYPLGDGTAYLTLFSQRTLSRVRLSDGAALDAVDLSAYADGDGIPDMTLMRAQGGELFVLLQRITIDALGFHTTDKSSVAIVDLATRSALGAYDFKLKNPTSEFKVVTPSRWLLGFNGEYKVRDGGIEAWDPQAKRSLGVVATEAVLDGEFVDFDWLDANRGLVILVSGGKTRLSAFSLTTGIVDSNPIQSDGYDLRQVLVDRERGVVYVADRAKARPGIRVLEARTLADTGIFISLALSPFHMELAP